MSRLQKPYPVEGVVEEGRQVVQQVQQAAESAL